MTQKDRDLLRSTFNQDAERYDRARGRATRRRCSTTWLS